MVTGQVATLPKLPDCFSANMACMEAMCDNQHWWTSIALKLAHLGNRNTQTGSRKNISAHYDLGNDFSGYFLTPQ